MIFFIVSWIVCFILLWIVYTRIFGAEWVKMPKNVRQKMLKMLELNKNDVFYDLGCGDGQLLMEAAPHVKKAIGIEIDLLRFLIAKVRTMQYKNVKIIYGNFFKKNLKNATKIALFLLKETNSKLGKKLKKECNNVVVASYKWTVPKLKLIKYDKTNRIYLQKTQNLKT